MHIFVPNIGGMIARPTDYLIWIGIFTIVLLSFINALRKETLILPTYRIYAFIFLALLLSTAIFNPIKNMDNFAINVFLLVVAVLLWLSLHQFDLKEKETILLIIFASTVIESAIGIMQFFGLYKYIPITPLSEGGAFQQKNLFASWVAVGIIISLYLITTDRFRNFHKTTKVLFLVCVAALSISLIISGSRIGLLGTALGAVVIFTSRMKHYSRKYLIAWLMVFFIPVAGGLFLLSVKDKVGIEKVVTKKIEWLLETEHPSYITRILMWKTSFEMFKEKPIFGQGFSNIGSLYMYYQAKQIQSNPEYKRLIDEYTRHPHNELLRIMAECGIVGILAILILVLGFVKILSRVGLKEAGLYVALLMPFLVHMMAEFPLESSTAHYLAFLIFLYMATSNFTEVRHLKIKKSASVLIVSLVVLIYIAVSAYTIRTLYDYMGMVVYWRKCEAKKIASVENLEGGAKNIYLRNWAKPAYMWRKANDALKDIEKNTEFLNDFLSWSEREKQRLPTRYAFYNDASVLFSLGVYHRKLVYFDEAMKTVEEGLSLYPNYEDLKRLKREIALEAVKTIFEGFQKK